MFCRLHRQVRSRKDRKVKHLGRRKSFGYLVLQGLMLDVKHQEVPTTSTGHTHKHLNEEQQQQDCRGWGAARRWARLRTKVNTTLFFPPSLFQKVTFATFLVTEGMFRLPSWVIIATEELACRREQKFTFVRAKRGSMGLENTGCCHISAIAPSLMGNRVINSAD